MGRLTRSLLSISTFLGLSFGGLTLAHTETELLRSYRWENRILLVLAEDSDDVRYQQLKQNIDQEACEVGDRDLLVGYLFANDNNQPSTFADQILSASKVDRLDDHHNPSDSDFVVVLIGKDGGTKLRSSTLINLNPIFSEIDSMPMRQQEMGNHDSCLSSITGYRRSGSEEIKDLFVKPQGEFNKVNYFMLEPYRLSL